MNRVLGAILAAAFWSAAAASADLPQRLTDTKIAEIIVRESRIAY
jgi:hypothetical protein